MNRKLKLWELKRATPEEFSAQPKFPIVVVLDNIRSFNNVGAFFRTADAFNVEKIYLCGITPQPPHREIQKTALGATETIEWEHVESTIEIVTRLKQQGFKVLTIEQAEKTTFLHHFPVTKEEQYAIVFGNEVDGVEQTVIDMADHIIEIPQFGTKHSLNVSVCAGVVLWEFTRQFAD
jgi:23S rRNA (guanosine2251-2'-O)-methyltransferase